VRTSWNGSFGFYAAFPIGVIFAGFVSLVAPTLAAAEELQILGGLGQPAGLALEANYPRYPKYPRYPNGPPGYPPCQHYPRYPCVPRANPPTRRPEKPRILGTRAISTTADSRGRLFLGGVLVECPASSGKRCGVLASVRPSRAKTKLEKTSFAVPSGRRSRVQMRLTRGSFSHVRIGTRVSVPIRIEIWDAAMQRSSRKLRLLIRASKRPKWSPQRALKHRSDFRRPSSGGGATSPAARVPVAIGISDQDGSTFSHPLFTGLQIGTARLVTPWNSVYTEPEVLDKWLRAAQAAGVEPLIAFEHARGDRCPENPCRLPSVEAYAAAFDDFHTRHPWVRLITPWNEPNHGSQPTATRPGRAARFYNTVRASCAGCTVVAGDVLDAPGMAGWLAEYQRGLVEMPRLWGLHNYYDTTYFDSSGVRTMLDLVPGEVWLTETGGIVSFVTSDGEIALPNDETRAEASVAFTFDLARRYQDRIGRVYLYQWQSPQGARFDAGLIRWDGRVRPAYHVLRRELGGRSARAEGSLATGLPHTGSSRARVVTRQVKLASHGYLSVPLACERGRATSCAGKVSMESAGYRYTRLVNGRPPGRILSRRSRSFEIPGARTSRLPFVLPHSVLAAATRRGKLSLRLTIGPNAEAETLRTKEVIVTVHPAKHPRVLSRGYRPRERE
jgi:hypothetical protein